MLPHEPRALRLAVRRSAERLIDQWSNREFVANWAEETANDSWLAGVRAAANYIRGAKFTPETPKDGRPETLFMDHYLEGYDQAVEEMTTLLIKMGSGK